jgi:hypothetical protein
LSYLARGGRGNGSINTADVYISDTELGETADASKLVKSIHFRPVHPDTREWFQKPI